MNKLHKLREQDYSRDASLRNYEVYDFDTVHGNETGINDGRMRLPSRYDIAKFYERQRKGSELGKWVKKSPEAIPVFTDIDFDWQVTYKFPSTLHKNKSPLGKVYGGANVSYRRLYLILCERFNEGEFFVDEYFNTVYKNSWVKERVDVELNNMKDELMYYAEDITEGAKVTKTGRLSKAQEGYSGYVQSLDEWSAYAHNWEEEKGQELADIIKDDIIRALANGEIPLKNVMSFGTREKRAKVGYNEEPLFYAMGDLIEHIQLFVKIGGGRWKTEQGIAV